MTKRPNDRLLFLGTGGGNDVFSTLLAAACMHSQGTTWKRCDIAGVLSPFHEHRLRPTGVPGLHETMPDSTRSLLRRTDPRRIAFVDAAVAGLVGQRRPFGAERVLAFSLERGSAGLAEALSAVAKDYDYVVLVDVGGDIFYSGPDDEHVLSPMFDAMTLRGQLDSSAQGILVEMGPGTDGELEPEPLTAALEQTGAFDAAWPVPADAIDGWAAAYDERIAPVRAGNTVPMTIKAWGSKEIVLREPYRARAHIGDVSRYAEFMQRIYPALSKKFYVVKPDRIRNPFAVFCDGPVDWYRKTQIAQRRTNNEADLEYVDVGGERWQFLTPSPLLAEKDRDDLLDLGLLELTQGVCDGAWMEAPDWEARRGFWQRNVAVREDGPMVKLFRR
jgi:hypothetical protein